MGLLMLLVKIANRVTGHMPFGWDSCGTQLLIPGGRKRWFSFGDIGTDGTQEAPLGPLPQGFDQGTPASLQRWCLAARLQIPSKSRGPRGRVKGVGQQQCAGGGKTARWCYVVVVVMVVLQMEEE